MAAAAAWRRANDWVVERPIAEMGGRRYPAAQRVVSTAALAARRSAIACCADRSTRVGLLARRSQNRNDWAMHRVCFASGTPMWQPMFAYEPLAVFVPRHAATQVRAWISRRLCQPLR